MMQALRKSEEGIDRAAEVGWLRAFRFLGRIFRDGSRQRTGFYQRYTGHLNLVTGEPHSHNRENARRQRQIATGILKI